MDKNNELKENSLYVIQFLVSSYQSYKLWHQTWVWPFGGGNQVPMFFLQQQKPPHRYEGPSETFGITSHTHMWNALIHITYYSEIVF